MFCFHQSEMSRRQIQSWCGISMPYLPCWSFLYEWLCSHFSYWMQCRNIQSPRSRDLPCMSFRNTFQWRGIVLFPLSCRALLQWPKSASCSLYLIRILEQWWRGMVILQCSSLATIKCSLLKGELMRLSLYGNNFPPKKFKRYKIWQNLYG